MIEIHTLGWNGDHAVQEGEDPNVSIYARVFVDGIEIPQVNRVRTLHRQDFSLAVVTLIGPIEIRNHTQDSWRALDDRPKITRRSWIEGDDPNDQG